jgi:hypothetical protein
VGVRVGVGEGLNEGEVVGVGVRDEGAGGDINNKELPQRFYYKLQHDWVVGLYILYHLLVYVSFSYVAGTGR